MADILLIADQPHLIALLTAPDAIPGSRVQLATSMTLGEAALLSTKPDLVCLQSHLSGVADELLLGHLKRLPAGYTPAVILFHQQKVPETAAGMADQLISLELNDAEILALLRRCISAIMGREAGSTPYSITDKVELSTASRGGKGSLSPVSSEPGSDFATRLAAEVARQSGEPAVTYSDAAVSATANSRDVETITVTAAISSLNRRKRTATLWRLGLAAVILLAAGLAASRLNRPSTPSTVNITPPLRQPKTAAATPVSAPVSTISITGQQAAADKPHQGSTLPEPERRIDVTIRSITAREPCAMVDALLKSLGIAPQRGRDLAVRLPGSSEALQVPADRFFQLAGRSYLVNCSAVDPDRYTLYRLLEGEGYRIINIREGDGFRPVAERLLATLGHRAAFGRHAIYLDSGRKPLHINGFLLKQGRDSRQLTLLTNASGVPKRGGMLPAVKKRN